MIRYITIGLITLLTGMLNSCYEDKGHYKYDWVQEIDLTDVLKDTTVGRGNVLHIEVDLKKRLLDSENETEVANPDDYTFEWKALTGEENVILGTDKDLTDTIWLASGNSYQVNYTVTEKKTGVSWISDFKLNVVEGVKGGFIFMTEDTDRKVDIEIYADDDQLNKFTLNGNPRRIAYLNQQLRQAQKKANYEETKVYLCFDRGTYKPKFFKPRDERDLVAVITPDGSESYD